jgi:general secretion pathway protein D
MIARQVHGLNLMVTDGDHPYKLVYLHMDHAHVDAVLNAIALSAGAVVTRGADGIYYLRPADAVPAQAVAAGPEETDYEWRKLILDHSIPADILALMGWAQNGREVDPFSRVRTAPFNSNTITSPGTGVNSAVAPSLSANGGTGFAGGPQNNGLQNNGGFGGQTQFGGDQGGQSGFGAGGAGFAGGGQSQRSGELQQNNGPAGGRGNPLPVGVERIFALEADNSLVLYSTVDGYNKVRQLVTMVDVKPRQVQIKVAFVTASVNDVDAFGINFQYQPYFSINQGSSANLSSTPQTFIGEAQGRLVVQLYDSLSHGKGQIEQSPLITTTNNVSAEINIAQQIPYTTTSTLLNGNGTGASNTTTQFLTINTGLAVSPRINSDDTVTLSLAPQISDVSGTALSNGAPPTVTETLTTLRTVRSGETMVIGGLVRKSETVSQNRVPLLSELPVLGSLFRSHNNSVDDSELLIFVTPTIIGDNTDTAPPPGPHATR